MVYLRLCLYIREQVISPPKFRVFMWKLEVKIPTPLGWYISLWWCMWTWSTVLSANGLLQSDYFQRSVFHVFFFFSFLKNWHFIRIPGLFCHHLLHPLFSVSVKIYFLSFPSRQVSAYMMWLVLRETSRKFEHVCILYGGRRRLPFSGSQRWRDTRGQKQRLEWTSLSVTAATVLPVLWDALHLERASFSLHFNSAASETVGSGQSWQRLHYVFQELFGGLSNLQPLQLASRRPGNRRVWPAAQAVTPGCCSLARTHLLCSTLLLLWGRFHYLTEGTASGSWGLSLYLSAGTQRHWVTFRGGGVGVFVEGSCCILLSRCFYSWLEIGFSVPSVRKHELRKRPFSFGTGNRLLTRVMWIFCLWVGLWASTWCHPFLPSCSILFCAVGAPIVKGKCGESFWMLCLFL